MANIVKKANEIRILKQFLSLLDVSGYQSDIRPENKRESPDMVICWNKKQIGIELTDLFPGKSPKYLFHNEKLVTALCHELNKQTAPYVGLIVGSISTNFVPIRLRDFSTVVSTIMKYIEQAKTNYEAIPYLGLAIKTGDKYIDSFQFRIIKASGINRVMMVYATQIVDNPCICEKIQACLDTKESKIQGYVPCSERWLVIHTNSFRPLQYWGDNNRFIKGHRFHSTFDRVFIYDEGNKQIDELMLVA